MLPVCIHLTVFFPDLVFQGGLCKCQRSILIKTMGILCVEKLSPFSEPFNLLFVFGFFYSSFKPFPNKGAHLECFFPPENVSTFKWIVSK